MTANKVRVQVRGSVGKSVRFPTNTGGAGATIGLDFRLPDGSVPTLQQLAAALVTGSAIQDQPGNIIPPGGGPTVIWQNIQYIPAPILNPPRYVHAEEEAGEEYHRMAVVGPIGPRGLQGIPGLRADDPEDPMPGPPGAAGAAGTAGSAGPPGAISAVHLWPDDPEDHISIPGSAGPPGNNGLQGAPGVISAVHLWPDDAEDPGLIPGAPGQAGVAGSPGPPGAISAVHLWPDDPEDPGLIPGASGPAGAAGAQGPAGVISAVHLWPDDPEDMIHMPGVQGNVGAQGPAGVISAVHLWPDDPEDAGLIPGATGPVGPQGPAGSSSSSAGVGWAAYLDQDWDDASSLCAPPNDPRFKTVTIDSIGTTSADIAFEINNKTSTVPYMSVAGDGSGFVAPTATTGLNWSATGNFTLQTPASAATAALTINGAAAPDAVLRLNPANSASVGLKILDPGANATQFRLNTNNTQVVMQALGTTTDLVLQTSGGVALKLSSAGLMTATATGAGTHSISSLTGVSDTLALNAPSGRFTSLLFNNAGVTKAQMYWDNTNSFAAWGVPGSGVRLTSTGILTHTQPTPTAVNATATLTIAQLLTTIITSTTALATTGTLPTGTLSDAGFLNGAGAVSDSFDWSVINTGALIFSVAAGVGHTLVGAGAVAAATSALFRTVKTAANTFITYRLAV